MVYVIDENITFFIIMGETFMATLDKKRLGDILVRSGKITYDQLNEALMSQKVLGKKLGEILLDNGTIQ
mgnify:FL=1